MSMAFEGRKALVTGAGGGLGYEIALHLATLGADVVLHYSHPSEQDRIDILVHEITELGCRVFCKKLSFQDLEKIPDMVREATNFLGGLDIVVNTAGITLNKSLADTTLDHFQLLMNVNIGGAWRVIQSARDVLEKSKHASVINFSSIHAAFGSPGHSAYAITKAGIEGMTHQLAIELAPRIRVNAIAPGHIVIPGLKEVWPEYDEQRFAKTIPVGFCGQPSDIANLVEFLASEKSRYITGAVIPIDGGNRCRKNFTDFDNSVSNTPFGYPWVPGVELRHES